MIDKAAILATRTGSLLNSGTVEDRTGYTGPVTAGELLALLVDRYSRVGRGTSGATLLIEAAMAMYGEDQDDAVERVGNMITDAMIRRA